MTKQSICKNKVCVSNKTIKLGTMKAQKRIHQLQRKKKMGKTKKRKMWIDSKFLKEKIYFYNIEENTSYRTELKSTWEHNKDKRGFLYLAGYKNFILENYKPNPSEIPAEFLNRMIGPSIMIFNETDKMDIINDPEWSKMTGITLEKPYSFGISNRVSFADQTVDKPITKNSKLSLSDFNEFIKVQEHALQGKNLMEEFEFAKPYIAKYSDLLDTFYQQSSFGDTNIFGIVRQA